MSVPQVLAMIGLVLAVISLFPQAAQYPLLAVAVILVCVALLVPLVAR